MDDNTKSSHLSRVRRKIPRLYEDAEELRKHRPEIYENMRASICERGLEERIDSLEERVETLENQLDNGQYPNDPNDNNIDNATDSTGM